MRTLDNIWKLDFGTWGILDLIVFIVLVVLIAILFFFFLGFLIRRFADFVLPSERKLRTGFSEDELEHPYKRKAKTSEPFYIEDGILERDPKKFLMAHGIETFDAKEIKYQADKRLTELEKEEVEIRSRNEKIVNEYYGITPKKEEEVKKLSLVEELHFDEIDDDFTENNLPSLIDDKPKEKKNKNDYKPDIGDQANNLLSL